MQLEQQETFTIHGPQLEILGEVETKLPAPAKKRGVASLVLVALALVSVFGIGGARLKGTQTAAVAAYTEMCTTNSGRTDTGRLAQAAAQVVAEAGTILGEDNAAVQQAQKAVNEYIGDISRQQRPYTARWSMRSNWPIKRRMPKGISRTAESWTLRTMSSPHTKISSCGSILQNTTSMPLL